MTWLDNNIVVGLALAIPSFIIGILGYRQSQKASNKAEKAETIEQVITGLNSLTSNLQADNTALRQQIAVLAALPAEVENLKKEIANLKQEITNLKSKLK